MPTQLAPFKYPVKPHLMRRHQPPAKDKKDHLRDEFAFACVYCLWRETWGPPGHCFFHIEHRHAHAKGGTDDYANLVRACARCNLIKRDQDFGAHLNPEQTPYGTVIAVDEKGEVQIQPEEKPSVKSITAKAHPFGQELVKLLHLNTKNMTYWRKHLIDRYNDLMSRKTMSEKTALQFREAFGLPHDLPRLEKHPDAKNPPYWKRSKEGWFEGPADWVPEKAG